MQWFINEPFTLTASVFERCLALLNLICFVSSFVQYEGLISSQGLAPAAEALQRYQRRGVSFFDHPTLCFFLGASDSVLFALHVAGIAASLLAFFGVLTGPCILACALVYQSLKNVSGPFLGLQMHANLVETDLLYAVASPFLLATPKPLILLQVALVSRVMLGGALGKWTGGDSSWKDLTAMSWHYWTQPLPNPLSCYFHRLPMWVHRIETAMTFALEGAGAILCWAPLPGRIVAFFSFAAILAMINITGNYGFLAQMTMTEALCLLNDDVFRWLLSHTPGGDWALRFLESAFHSPWSLSRLLRLDAVFSWPLLSIVPYLPVVLYMLLGCVPLAVTCHGLNPLELLNPVTTAPMRAYQSVMANRPMATVTPYVAALFSSLSSIYPRFQAFDIALRYVKFSHMTKRRYELILQTSADGRQWHDVEWKAKPSSLSAFPPVLGPHIPMLDWRVWFLANEHARGLAPPDWYDRLMRAVLTGNRRVLALLGEVRGEVRWVRTLVFDYRFVHGAEAEEAERKAEEVRRRKRREADRTADEEAEDGVDDDEGLQAWRAARRQKADREAAEGVDVVVRPDAWWYRLRFVGQYGRTLQAGDDG